MARETFDHAARSGLLAVRNLAFFASGALIAGFALGLYSLMGSEVETTLGKTVNNLAASIWQARPLSAASAAKAPVPVSGHAKPVKTVSLTVSDATGVARTGIALKLSLAPAGQTFDTEVQVLDVPKDAVLTAGRRRSDGVWILTPSQLDGVALVLSSKLSGPLVLRLEAVSAKTGELLTPTRYVNVAWGQPAAPGRHF